MTESNTDDGLIERLDHLLERERAALVHGDLKAISTLLEEKAALLGEISESGSTAREGLRGLQEKALRNQALLDSALVGIRTVATRFATLRRIRKSLETYDEHGQKTSLTAKSISNMEKRA